MSSDLDVVPAVATRREEALGALGKMVARGLGWVGYVEMAIFAATLVAGLVYVWKKGALDWNRE